mmetsp:Transcript_45323/g.116014  ORF Transcript_45323/g.116014 Transcript_45323/m.116014 type:complete len:346 (+) Transcript_45323:227-1264(+)
MDCGTVLTTIDEIVHEPGFVEQCKDFVNQNCEKFTDDAELKLEYTPIHNAYESLVEEHIAGALLDKLGDDFDMGVFMEQLPAYVESQGQADDANAATIDFLMSFGDIETFKDMMLVAKKDKLMDPAKLQAGGAMGFSTEQQTVLDEAKAISMELVNAMGVDAGWKVVSDKPWCKLERMTKGNDEFIRTTMVLDVSLEGGEEMILNFSPERTNWDSMMTNPKIIKKLDGLNDYIATYNMVLPMAKPRETCSRIIITRDTPEPGAVTYLYLEYDQATDTLAPASQSLGAGSMFPIEGEPGKCLIKSVDQLKSGWIPKFIMNWVITTWFPKMMTAQAAKYKKFKGLSK